MKVREAMIIKKQWKLRTSPVMLLALKGKRIFLCRMTITRGRDQ